MTLTASRDAARRLAVVRQRLTGRFPTGDRSEALVGLLHDLAYVQWDPVSILAPSHLLAIQARLGRFQSADLDRALWQEKLVFEHWTPIASLVLTEDYPLYASLMRRYPGSLSPSWGAQREGARTFLAGHRPLRRRMLADLRGGPLRLGDFTDHAPGAQSGAAWTPSSDVAQMLSHLAMQGEVMVVGHDGNQNLCGRTEEFLPKGVDRVPLPAAVAERVAAERALRALGTATAAEITYHFVRGRYLNLRGALGRLERDGRIHRVGVAGLPPREARYVHDADVELLAALEAPLDAPRVSLLPPFDNLICSTSRTALLFGFRYVREQFLPAARRRFGLYVLPILAGDRFVGRLDARLNRERRALEIVSLHAEPLAREDRGDASGIREAVERLADQVGADRIHYPSRIPAVWRGALG